MSRIISGTGYDCFLSLPQREKGGEMGEKGVEKPVFYNFLNSTYPEISKKIGFRGSAFPFPPFSLLRSGRRNENYYKLSGNKYVSIFSVLSIINKPWDD